MNQRARPGEENGDREGQRRGDRMKRKDLPRVDQHKVFQPCNLAEYDMLGIDLAEA